MERQTALSDPFSDSPILSAFEHAPIGMGILHPDGTVLQANRYFHHVCGGAGEGKNNLRLEEMLDPDDRQAYLQASRLCGSHPSALPVSVRFPRTDGGTS